MALELKTKCEKCGSALLPEGVAFICTYECTFCENCAPAMDYLCPNCGGELVRRPRKKSKVSFVRAFADDELGGEDPPPSKPTTPKSKASRRSKRRSR